MRVKRIGVKPEDIRLSDHFLLSDFMGCNSVYSKGLRNVWEDADGSKLREARHLCDTILEPILGEHGPLSVSYGYISPDLSRKIVTYQDPDKPSYHRWDKGAAADVCVHSWVEHSAPVLLAHEIDRWLGYSRMITYSESPYICLASQLSEGDKPRRAFYENRYTGKSKQKPLYVRMPVSKSDRERERQAALRSVEGWEGAGYPTYHGGGHRQAQHRRTSRFSMAIDFMYSAEAVSAGVPNAVNWGHQTATFEAAGAMYDELLEALDVPRISVVKGFQSARVNPGRLHSWEGTFEIDFKPPIGTTASDVADAALSIRNVVSAGADNTRNVAKVVGKVL